MIKVLISDASVPVAGGIIRLLVNHPDIEIVSAYSPSSAGELVAETHYGLCGDTGLRFSDRLSLDKADVAFICTEDNEASAIREHAAQRDDFRVIDLAKRPSAEEMILDGEWIYGLSEIFRKPLVRGARLTYVPETLEIVALIMLYPLAANLLLNGDIDIRVSMPGALLPSSVGQCAARVARVLSEFQKGWQGKISFTISETESCNPGIRLSASMPCKLTMSEVEKIYEGIYDDHNFTFLCPRMDFREVTGTHKCLLNLRPCGDVLEMEAIADAVLRGGAGEAVHLLNLLFGLQEKIGLSLNAYSFPQL